MINEIQQQLEAAFIKAHESGNKEDAKILADEIRSIGNNDRPRYDPILRAQELLVRPTAQPEAEPVIQPEPEPATTQSLEKEPQIDSVTTEGIDLDEKPIKTQPLYDDKSTTTDTTQPKAEALSNEAFINDWGKTYQTDNDPVKNKEALKRLNNFNKDIKPEAISAMKVAGAIFDGDRNISSDQIQDYLTKVGIVESNFNTKKQKGNGPARSYWQVEPTTALDLSKNSQAFFGEKFNTEFKKYAKDGQTAIKTLATMSEEEMSKLLLEDDNLAASYAAAKYIATH